MSFNSISIFNVSQTDGKSDPQLKSLFRFRIVSKLSLTIRTDILNCSKLFLSFAHPSKFHFKFVAHANIHNLKYQGNLSFQRSSCSTQLFRMRLSINDRQQFYHQEPVLHVNYDDCKRCLNLIRKSNVSSITIYFRFQSFSCNWE